VATGLSVVVLSLHWVNAAGVLAVSLGLTEAPGVKLVATAV
jgi:hypothetical protein